MPNRDCFNEESRMAGEPSKEGSKPRARIVSPEIHDAPYTAERCSATLGLWGGVGMGRRDIYFGLDCEMVGTGPHGTDSALARVSIVNWNAEVVLDTYVRVSVPVTDYRTHISGVHKENIESDDAMSLDEVRRLVLHILRGKILVGHGLENDLVALNIFHPWSDMRDTAQYGPFMMELPASYRDANTDGRGATFRPRKLRDLAWEKLGRVIQAEQGHSSIEDAAAAMDLYKVVRDSWELAIDGRVSEVREQKEQDDRERRKLAADHVILTRNRMVEAQAVLRNNVLRAPLGGNQYLASNLVAPPTMYASHTPLFQNGPLNSQPSPYMYQQWYHESIQSNRYNQGRPPPKKEYNPRNRMGMM
jgi:RNA exonuclease 4